MGDPPGDVELPEQVAPVPEPQGVRMTGMREAVEQDIAAMGELKSKSARSLTKLALWLADSIDARGHDMSPANVARVAQELRATLIALTTERADDGDRFSEWVARMSAPVWDSENPGPANAGASRRGDRGGTR